MRNTALHCVTVLLAVLSATVSRASIQGDINALGADGGTVVIPAGVTTVSATITVPDYVTLKGACANAVLRAANGLNGPLIRNADPSGGNTGIRLVSLAIDGNKGNQTGGAGIQLTNVTDAVIEDVKVHDCYASGILISGGSRDVRVDCCIIYGNGVAYGDGVQADSAALVNITVSNSTIYSNRSNGIKGNGSDFRVYSNYIHGHQSADDGVKFVGGKGAVVLGNRIKGAANGGIEFNTASDFIVTANQITEAGSGVDVRSSEDFVINGNISRDNDVGVMLSAPAGASGAIVSNNMALDNSSAGITSDRYSHSVFAGNLNVDNGVGGGTHYGMIVKGAAGDAARHVVLNANECIDRRAAPGNVQTFGVRLENIDSVIASDNILRGAAFSDLSEGEGVTNLAEDNNLVNTSHIDTEPADCSEVIRNGYQLASDLDADCRVTLNDLAVLTNEWLLCNDPATPGECPANWPTAP